MNYLKSDVVDLVMYLNVRVYVRKLFGIRYMYYTIFWDIPYSWAAILKFMYSPEIGCLPRLKIREQTGLSISDSLALATGELYSDWPYYAGITKQLLVTSIHTEQ